jgi:hypothetical protein
VRLEPIKTKHEPSPGLMVSQVQVFGRRVGEEFHRVEGRRQGKAKYSVIPVNHWLWGQPRCVSSRIPSFADTSVSLSCALGLSSQSLPQSSMSLRQAVAVVGECSKPGGAATVPVPLVRMSLTRFELGRVIEGDGTPTVRPSSSPSNVRSRAVCVKDQGCRGRLAPNAPAPRFGVATGFRSSKSPGKCGGRKRDPHGRSSRERLGLAACVVLYGTDGLTLRERRPRREDSRRSRL